jgi:hypothetical protein
MNGNLRMTREKLMEIDTNSFWIHLELIDKIQFKLPTHRNLDLANIKDNI